MSARPCRSPCSGGGVRRDAQRGVLLAGLLVVLALAALGAVQAGQRWAEARRRDAELELLFVGEQYRQAILSYWRESPGGLRRWPTRLDELLDDRRFPLPRRHLRRLYADPLAPQRPWGLVQQGAAIVGVYSEAPGVPFRQTGFTAEQRGFEGAGRYADWRFVAEAPATAASAVPAAAAPAPAGRPGAPTPRRLSR